MVNALVRTEPINPPMVAYSETGPKPLLSRPGPKTHPFGRSIAIKQLGRRIRLRAIEAVPESEGGCVENPGLNLFAPSPYTNPHVP